MRAYNRARSALLIGAVIFFLLGSLANILCFYLQTRQIPKLSNNRWLFTLVIQWSRHRSLMRSFCYNP